MILNKSPGFQFYPAKWLAGTSHLDDASERAYHRVLCWMWLNSPDQCSMPDTDEAWTMATGFKNEKLKRCRNLIQNHTHPLLKRHGNKLISNGLRKEVLKQKQYRQKQSDNAKQRWHKEITAMPPHEPPHEPPDIPSQCLRGHAMRGQCSSSSSSSSSDNSTVILSEEGGRGEGDRMPEYVIDYGKEKPPEIKDYQDINADTNDPILVAIAITGERTVQSWGYWVKTRNRARREMGQQDADAIFRKCLCELWGEIKQGECHKPGACLNLKLKKVFDK